MNFTRSILGSSMGRRDEATPKPQQGAISWASHSSPLRSFSLLSSPNLRFLRGECAVAPLPRLGFLLAFLKQLAF